MSKFKHELSPGQLWLWEESLVEQATKSMIILLVEPKTGSKLGPGAWTACISTNGNLVGGVSAPLELEPSEVEILKSGGGNIINLEIKVTLLQEAP